MMFLYRFSVGPARTLVVGLVDARVRIQSTVQLLTADGPGQSSMQPPGTSASRDRPV